MSQQAGHTLSFELFPPKTAQGLEHLKTVCAELQTYQPHYFSVTFGAAGSNQDKTLAVVQQLTEQHIAVAPHLTCIGMTKQHVISLLEHYQQHHVRRLVVIRGDLPESMVKNTGDFNYAHELVAFIRQQFTDQFQIEVAAYPEFHPQALNATEDFTHFCKKVAAGANHAITQFFFNIDSYFYFLEDCQKHNITIPIIPGIMPISNFTRLCHFANLCGAEIPAWLKKRIYAYGDDVTSIQQFGIELITKLCKDLLASGAPGLHFYTLNNTEPTCHILNNLTSVSHKKNVTLNV